LRGITTTVDGSVVFFSLSFFFFSSFFFWQSESQLLDEPDESWPLELESPEELSPDELSPDELSPDELSPEELLPEELLPDVLSAGLPANASGLPANAAGLPKSVSDAKRTAVAPSIRAIFMAPPEDSGPRIGSPGGVTPYGRFSAMATEP
jgi:hypothetical protein